MSDFTYGNISCDFTNTLMDDIALGVYLAAFKLPENAPIDAKGISTEVPQRSWQRAYCVITAHSKNVQGAGGWQPPASPFDVTITELRLNRDQFFRVIAADDSDLVVEWSKALYERLTGKQSLVSEEEQSSGDKDTDFLELKGN